MQPREHHRIQCLECRRWFRALPRHLLRAHDRDDEDYRLKFGVPVGVPLVCIEWSENQSERNIEREARRTLTGRGPKPGFEQRESVRRQRKQHYRTLAQAGTVAAAQQDRTAERRKQLEPYPVTVQQAADRLGCAKSAAYTFLSFCVQTGRLKRIARGLYDQDQQ